MFSALKDAVVGGSSAVIQVVSGTDQRGKCGRGDPGGHPGLTKTERWEEASGKSH